jgi:hypothetical protein
VFGLIGIANLSSNIIKISERVCSNVSIIVYDIRFNEAIFLIIMYVYNWTPICNAVLLY